MVVMVKDHDGCSRLDNNLMDAQKFLFYGSWPHEVIEMHPHDAPEISCFEALEAPKLLVPEVDLAVQALDAVVRERVISLVMHELRRLEVRRHMLHFSSQN